MQHTYAALSLQCEFCKSQVICCDKCKKTDFEEGVTMFCEGILEGKADATCQEHWCKKCKEDHEQ